MYGIVERTVRTMKTLEEAIIWYEKFVNTCKYHNLPESQKEFEQLADWLSILKKAKFEYDEAWRILTRPTPDVTYADRDRAQMILDTFRDSLGRME